MLNFKNIYFDGSLDGGGRGFGLIMLNIMIFQNLIQLWKCVVDNFYGVFLGMKYGVHDIHLVDIHPPCLQSIQETNKHNNLRMN